MYIRLVLLGKITLNVLIKKILTNNEAPYFTNRNHYDRM